MFWPSCNTYKVQALLDEGLLNLVCNLDELDAYWNQLLRDFPHHPANGHRDSSFPLSMYGHWVHTSIKDFKIVVCSSNIYIYIHISIHSDSKFWFDRGLLAKEMKALR